MAVVDENPIQSGMLASRFAEKRALRTRATGTPFRARWDGHRVVVTPMSGIERHIERREILACWPYIARDAPRSRWRHLTNNGSYLEAIYDDLSARDETAAPPRASTTLVSPDAPAKGDAEPVDLETRLLAIRRELDETVAENRRLKADLATAVAADESSAQARASIGLLERRLKAIEAERDAAVAAGERLRRMTATSDGALSHAESEAARAVATARTLESEVAQLRAELEAMRTGTADFGRLDALIRAPLGAIRTDFQGGLRRAGELAREYPRASVAESRLVLEIAVSALWRESKGTPPDGRGTGLLLEDLRNAPLLPPGDWHLGKNLWSRASAVVHGETKPRTDVAWWILLGTLQFCELVPPKPRDGARR